MQIFRLYLIAIATVVLVVACDRMPLTSPTGSTISLSAERTILPLNGQTTVRAVVTESGGTPVHNGTIVTFNPSIGAVIPADAATVNGVATATFFAGSNSGTGFIHAFSGGARTGSGNSSSGGVEVRIGAAAAGALSVSATPPSVSQSGGTVTISALVLDSGNNPLPGVSVLFTSSTGTLSATSALSDSSGIARTQLTTTQTTTVTAIAGTAKGEVRVDVSTAPGVSIETDGQATMGVPEAITVTFSGGGGNVSPRQIASLTVDFGDGTVETRTNVTGAVAFTHVYGRSGGFTITARAVDVGGNTGIASRAIIVTQSRPTAQIDIKPNPADVNQIVGFAVKGEAATGAPPIETVRVFINGELVFSTSGASGAFTKGFNTAGTYIVVAEAVDAAGSIGRTQTFLVVE